MNTRNAILRRVEAISAQFDVSIQAIYAIMSGRNMFLGAIERRNYASAVYWFYRIQRRKAKLLDSHRVGNAA